MGNFITTSCNLPLPILSFFNPYMLDPLLGMLKRVENVINPLSMRKIRDQDTGKRKEYNELLIKFMETYERKKAEEKKYKEKIENSEKIPYLPNQGSTCKFTRFLPKE